MDILVKEDYKDVENCSPSSGRGRGEMVGTVFAVSPADDTNPSGCRPSGGSPAAEHTPG